MADVARAGLASPSSGIPDDEIDKITHETRCGFYRSTRSRPLPRAVHRRRAAGRATDVDTTPREYGTGKFKDEGIVTTMTLVERMANR